MHISRVVKFLQQPNNAVFVTEHSEPWRWLESVDSVMYVNHSRVLMRIVGTMQLTSASETSVPWQALKSTLIQDFKRLPSGYMTFATFDTSPTTTQPIQTGQSYSVSEIEGTDSPILGIIVGVTILASLVMFFSQFKSHKTSSSTATAPTPTTSNGEKISSVK